MSTPEEQANTPVSVSVSLANGNGTQIQKSPNDWSDFLPPTTWSGTSDPVIAAVGDGAYGTMVPQSVVTSIMNADPALFIYLGDVYESGHLHRAIQPLRRARPQR